VVSGVGFCYPALTIRLQIQKEPTEEAITGMC